MADGQISNKKRKWKGKKKELEYTKITHALFKDMWKTSLDFDSRRVE